MNVYIIGLLAGFLTHFINYCIGKPDSEFSPYEIFSTYTVWLSKMRLKRLGLWTTYYKEYHRNLLSTEEEFSRITVKNEFKRLVHSAAEPFFTWERAVGMCSVCSGFWISLAVGLVFAKEFTEICAIILISHVTIRLLNKVL